jgi:GT2 family glycosyltransferase
MTARVTLYVPCYNSEAFLAGCLQGIAAQTRAPERLLVIDDGSTDGSVEIARSHGVEVIRHQRNGGLVAARTTALTVALETAREGNGTGIADDQLLAALDADCVPEPRWLETLVCRLTDDAALAAVGGALHERYAEAPGDRWRAVHMAQHWGPAPCEPRFLFGANTAHRLSALRRLGGFDQRLRNNFEDVELSERLLATGHRLGYEPAARVHHLRRDDHRSVLRTYWNWLSPAYLLDGLYDDLEGLLQLLDYDLAEAAKRLELDLKADRPELLYLDLLLFPYHGLLDLEEWRRRQSEANCTGSPEAAAMAELRAELLVRAGVLVERAGGEEEPPSEEASELAAALRRDLLSLVQRPDPAPSRAAAGPSFAHFRDRYRDRFDEGLRLLLRRLREARSLPAVARSSDALELEGDRSDEGRQVRERS